MSRGSRLGTVLAAVVAAGVLLVAPPLASGHVTERAGDVRLTMGWGHEPAYSGFENFVEVALTDASGAPVTELRDPLQVEVSHAGAHVVLPLMPTARPGALRAPLMPTRAGTYAFHVTGRVNHRSLDQAVTCSDRTFACVSDAAEIQFPVADPSGEQIARRLARALPRAARTQDDAASARTLALAAVGLAAFGLLLVAALALRLRRTRRRT